MTEDTTTPPASEPVAGPVQRPVRPRAWAIFVDNGNARLWSTLQPHVQKLADAEGLTITPLYDQAALDAAVAAERERWIGLVREFVDFLEPMRFDRPSDDAKAAALDEKARALLEGPNAKLNGGP